MEALNNLAWLLATASDDKLRDGAEAARSRRTRLGACRRSKACASPGTLAAAYAEAGRFPEAIATAEKAVQDETAAGETRICGPEPAIIDFLPRRPTLAWDHRETPKPLRHRAIILLDDYGLHSPSSTKSQQPIHRRPARNSRLCFASCSIARREQFEERAFGACLYWRARILAPLIRKLCPGYFDRDFALIRFLANTPGRRDAMNELAAFQEANNSRGSFARKTLRIRISARKSSQLIGQVFERSAEREDPSGCSAGRALTWFAGPVKDGPGPRRARVG